MPELLDVQSLIEAGGRGILVILAVTVARMHVSKGFLLWAIGVMLFAWAILPVITATQRKPRPPLIHQEEQ